MALDAVYGAGLNEFPPRPGTLTATRVPMMAFTDCRRHSVAIATSFASVLWTSN